MLSKINLLTPTECPQVTHTCRESLQSSKRHGSKQQPQINPNAAIDISKTTLKLGTHFLWDTNRDKVELNKNYIDCGQVSVNLSY